MIEATLHAGTFYFASCRLLWSYFSIDGLAWFNHVKWSISDMWLNWFHGHQHNENNCVKVKRAPLWHVPAWTKTSSVTLIKEQECIPAGCVPSAAVGIGEGDVCPGGCLLWGVSVQGGVCPDGIFPGGDCPGVCVYPNIHWGRHPHV